MVSYLQTLLLSIDLTSGQVCEVVSTQVALVLRQEKMGSQEEDTPIGSRNPTSGCHLPRGCAGALAVAG